MSKLKNISLALLPAAMGLNTGVSMAQTQVSQHKNDDRPNILFIMCDDHAMQTISAYGSAISKLAPTPNIDRLAKRGMLFNNCFVENSLSSPARACLMTGLYSHQNGQQMLAEGVDSTKRFFSEDLQASGYQTGVVGKWHLMTRPKGFDYAHIWQNQGSYYNPVYTTEKTYGKYVQEMGYATELTTKHSLDFLESRDRNRPFCLLVHHKAPHRNWMPALKYLNKYANTVFPLPETFYDDYSTRGSAAHTQKMSVIKDMQLIYDLKVPELLDTNSLESRAEYDGYYAGVARMTPQQRKAWDAYYMPRNKKFLEAKLTGRALDEWKYQNYLRDYLAVIASVDESVGKLLDYLEKNDLDKNTIVIYTSDQGFYMGEHGWFDKRFMYEESLHTPLIISYPGHVKEGSINNDMIQNIDFAPTFYALSGLKQPKEMTGRSLLPILEGKKPKDWRTSLYYHYYDYPNYHLVRKHDGVRTERYKLIYFYGKGGDRAVQENKYQRTKGTAEYWTYKALQGENYFTDDPDVSYFELYDLKTDPNELNNIYGQKGTEKATKELMKLLKKYRKDLKVDTSIM